MNRTISKIPLLFLSVSILMMGCAGAPKTQLGTLYNQSAMHLEAERNPVIVIPGILGSRLKDEKTGQVVWGAFSRSAANPKKPEGARLFALPMDGKTPVEAIDDGVVPDGALDKFFVNLFFINFRLNAYYHILKSLGVGGYRDQNLAEGGDVHYGDKHFTCFQFDYDWRKDISTNAKLLDAYIREKRVYVAREIEKRFGVKNPDVKFDIVAHSMGGLLARYYLRYGTADLPKEGETPNVTWAGAKHVKKLIMIGTPNGGSVKAVDQLVHGFGGHAFVPKYEPAVIGTMPSIYMLMPPSRHRLVNFAGSRTREEIDLFDPETWIKMKWGLADPNQDTVLKMLLPDVTTPGARRELALKRLRENLNRAKRFRKAMDIEAKKPKGIEFFLFVGDAVDTESVIEVDPVSGEIAFGKKAPGDGTVTRASALLDERTGGKWRSRVQSPIEWGQVYFLFTDHLGLTKDPAFTDNILYLLLESPFSKTGSK